MKFKYTGDAIGSPLKRDVEYEIVRSPFMGVDYVEIERTDETEKRIKLTRTEWQTYDELGLIEAV
jgi:hypothetical protein